MGQRFQNERSGPTYDVASLFRRLDRLRNLAWEARAGGHSPKRTNADCDVLTGAPAVLSIGAVP